MQGFIYFVKDCRPPFALATVVFPSVCTMVFPKVLWFCCGVQFLGKSGPQACSVDLFTQLSSNKFCKHSNTHSPSQDLVNYNTCSVSPHAQAKRKCSGMPSLLVVVAVTVLMLQ